MKSELLKSRIYKIRFGDMSDNNYLKVVVPVREVSSAPHSRSCSLKKSRRRPQDLDLKDKFRPRTNSLPSCSGHQHRHRHGSAGSSRDSVNRAASSDKLCRVRSFKLTSKGLVNHGDCFKRLSSHSSLMSTGSAASDLNQPASDHGGHLSTNTTTNNNTTTTTSSTAAAASSSSCPSYCGLQRSRAHSEASEASSSGVGSGGSGGTGSAPSFFRVVLKGTSGVGKSALLRQFMTSEYRGTFDVTTPDTEDPETTVSVLLDGEESMLEFIDEPKDQELEGLRADAYVVVFSLADHQSYTSAVELVRHLRVDLGLDRAVLLVGNKLDLVRQRRVEEREARTLASKYDSHYQETSAALNHQVDDLLVAVLSQIRRSLAPPISQSQTLLSAKTPLIHCCSPSPRRAISFLSRLFTPTKKTKSFDNLLVY